MIRKVVIRRFKKFSEVEFVLPHHIVLAGPNDTGKTTMLQAVAAWSMALDRWKRQNDFQRHGGYYTKVPITRQQFSAVPLRSFDLLWQDRSYRGSIEIEIHAVSGWRIPLEFVADSTEQVYARPLASVDPSVVRESALTTVFVPPMTGLTTDEPVFTKPRVDQLLGQAKPGDVLRNLLVEASQSDRAWKNLTAAIRRLFGYDLLPPDSSGASILAEFIPRQAGPRLDIASGGSGFQQVLMLLTFLHTRPASILLLDEPDAHLHVILQDAIFGELRSAAAEQGSQLVIATHSEVIINTVEPDSLCIMLQQPKLLASTEERGRLIESLKALTNTDIMLAEDAPGVLYLEGPTDLELLRTWARVLGHPAHELLTVKLFWKPTVAQPRPGAAGIRAEDHFDSLRLVRDDLPGLEILDRDGRPGVPATAVTGTGLQRIRWNRYEIESYLVHPTALARFVEKSVGGGGAAAPHVADLQEHFRQEYPPAFLSDPLGDHAFLNGVKARTELLPKALTAAGISGVPYTRYHEIAAVMTPDEVHPEVKSMLDAICGAFRR